MIETIFHITDDLLFFCISLIVLYLIIFTFASHGKKGKYSKATRMYRFAILLPPNETFPQQGYPNELYSVITYKDLTTVVKELDDTRYDMAIILQDVRQISPKFLDHINNAYDTGIKAIQLHTVATNRTGLRNKLKMILTEADNSISGKGNTQLGLSSTLKGPNIAVDLKWLKRNQKSSQSNLERKLLKQDIYTEYMDDVIVYSNTIPTPSYSTSRRKALSQIPVAFLNGNWSYCNRIFQWFIPSIACLFIVTACWTLLTTGFEWTISLKWWIIWFTLSFIISLAIPDYLIDDKKKKKRKSS